MSLHPLLASLAHSMPFPDALSLLLLLQRLLNIAKEMGFVKLATTGLMARCVMIGTLTAGQFGIFDTVMNAVGASKFHFHDPKAQH